MKNLKFYLQLFSFEIILLVFASCQKEPTAPIDAHDHIGVHSEESRYSRSEISFNDFQSKFLNKYSNHVSNYFIPSENRGGDDFIVEVNTERIVEFSGDSVTTYTFNVKTSNEENESFTNLILFERNGQSGEVIFKYTPTTEWVNELVNGNKTRFSGTLSLMSTEGDVIQTDEVIDGEPQGKVAPCLFTAIPIWIDCYGASCPCPDGNGYLGGWDISVSCGPAGGGGGTGSGGGDPTGGGGSGSPHGGGDLPTDLLEWDLFFGLLNLRGPNDYFNLEDPNPYISQEYDDFEEFETVFNGLENYEVFLINNQDGTHTTHYSFDAGLSNINVFVKQTLRNTSNNQGYQLHSITTSYTGITLGKEWNITHTQFNIDPTNNVVSIDIWGTIGYSSYTEEIGNFFS
ncbi:MAG: hypothetical protein CL526_03425 [Aequorivita sp.]|nr:hypothetical protein [Aequorivita sp.]